jgi:hypothetical protein
MPGRPPMLHVIPARASPATWDAFCSSLGHSNSKPASASARPASVAAGPAAERPQLLVIPVVSLVGFGLDRQQHQTEVCPPNTWGDVGPLVFHRSVVRTGLALRDACTSRCLDRTLSATRLTELMSTPGVFICSRCAHSGSRITWGSRASGAFVPRTRPRRSRSVPPWPLLPS